MINKKKSRIRRATYFRSQIKKKNGILRLVVHKTSKHIYTQIINQDTSKVLVSTSTLEKNISKQLSYTGNKIASALIGKIIAKRALKLGINKVVFDRSGFKYHGRIKVLVDESRKSGLKI